MDQLKFNKLPRDIQGLLRDIGTLADAKSLSIWLVGGMVRDLLLGRPSLDIDVVVEGDGISFANALAKRFSSKIVVHRAFGTATVTMNNGLKIDVVTARRESYARPGSLPDVIPGQLSDDFFRRDFTINAIAVSLNTADFGAIRDDFDGRDDLRKKFVRIMHYRSFVDDPTRILRAVRYEKRFDFHLEPRTLSALKVACQEDAFITITPVRYFLEFRRILSDGQVIAALRRLRSLDGLRYLSFGPAEEKLLSKVVRSQEEVGGAEADAGGVWVGRLASLLSFHPSQRAEELMTLFNIARDDKQRIRHFLHFLSVPDMLVRLRQKNLMVEKKKRAS